MEKRILSWRFQNARAGEADIDIFDVIGDPWGEGTSASEFVKELRGLKSVSRINLHINSPGGYVNDALAMYAALQQHPAEVVAYIESQAASAASFVAMAADKVVIHKNAEIFIHDAHGLVMGNAKDARVLADLLDEQSDNIASIYAEKAGGTTTEWRDRMRANDFGTSYRGQAAVDAGLADEVMAAPVRNLEPGRIAALAPDSPPAPAVDLKAALEAARLTPPAPSIQQLIEQHQTVPLSAAITGG